MQIINPYVHSGGGASTLVLDTFTEASNTVLTSHTPDVDTVGGGWAVAEGGLTVIASGGYVVGATAGSNIAVIDAGVADCVITTDFYFGNFTNNQGLVCRYQDANNLYAPTVAAANGANPVLQIIERVSGSYLLRGTVGNMTGEGPLTNETWPMTVTLSGNTITAEIVVNGNTYTASYTSSSLATMTKHGIRPFNTSRADNFQIVG